MAASVASSSSPAPVSSHPLPSAPHPHQQRPLLFHSPPETKQHPNKCVTAPLTRRHLLSAASASAAFLFTLSPAALALLEADDDEELLEKVKEDRRKKIKRRGEVNSFKEETASVQVAVYQLSKTAQALDGNDFVSASQVLNETFSKDWISNVVKALSKVSSNPEEKSEAETFSSALASLKAAVIEQDPNLSKTAFVKSASALEKWSYLTGFSEQLKGL